ncbi:MAG: hypothetical protein JOY92_00070 [Verrucomicrobia bacterium]|nr:hypothetical protein [Verrucomicrobiota bacterium]
MNPFDDLIVTEPRRVGGTVDSINQEALERVVSRFREIAEARGDAPPRILLITSPEPGYGKSHLIGRIFRALQREALLIYIRPFQDAGTCWYNIVDKVAGELDLPERADKTACCPGDLTQLETISRLLLSSVFCRAVESGPLRSEALLRFIPRFRQQPVSIFNDPDIRDGFIGAFAAFLPALSAQLRNQTAALRNSASSWLSLLFHYALAGVSGAERQLCLDWLRGLPLEPHEATGLGLRAADTVPPELPPGERDEVCFRRLTDLCLLTASYRPFLFCFDQTELYNRSQGLAHAFGAVLSRLRRELINHLTIVTANQDVWERSILPYFEKADQHVIDQVPIRLSGIRVRQARELAHNRARLFSVDERKAEQFLSGAWFDKMFEARVERSARSVLQECALRWGGFRLPDVEELFRTYLREARRKVRSLAYDESIFRWFFETGLSKVTGVEITPFTSKRGYLTVCWKTGTNAILFCFESGNNYPRWNAIATEARHYRQHGAAKNLHVRTVGFRWPQQPEFGEKTRHEVLVPAESALTILRPSDDVAARIVAAYELYAGVIQGNHSQVTEEQVLTFLAAHFEKEVGEWLGSSPERDPEPVEPLDDRTAFIRERVKTLGSISWQILQADLEKAGLSTDLKTALACCSALEREVKVFTSPHTAFFQWISSRSP